VNSIPKIFVDSRVDLRYIEEIKGWGVFAWHDIGKNSLIEVAPVVVYPKKLIDVALWACQAEGIPNADLKIDQYTIGWQENVAFPLGWTGLYNHSDNPNCQFIADYEKSMLGIQTLRDIKADEQLFVSYGKTWFEEKGYITKSSWDT
jgi:SET domain-containing protein